MTLGTARETLAAIAKRDKVSYASVVVEATGSCCVLIDQAPLEIFASIAELDAWLQQQLAQINRALAERGSLVALAREVEDGWRAEAIAEESARRAL